MKAASIRTAFSLGELELWKAGSNCSLSLGHRVVRQGHALHALLSSLPPSEEGSESVPRPIPPRCPTPLPARFGRQRPPAQLWSTPLGNERIAALPFAYLSSIGFGFVCHLS